MPVFEIALITLTLLMGASIVWYTLLLGISPMPSSNKAQAAMLQLITLANTHVDLNQDSKKGAIIELGSGWGNLLIAIAKQYPQRNIVGYELSLLPWFISLLVIKILGLKNITLHRKDFLKADLSQASLMLCYLYPGAMVKIKDKLKKEPGQLEYLISHNFSLPLQQSINTIQLDDLYKSPVYLYQFKEAL